MADRTNDPAKRTSSYGRWGLGIGCLALLIAVAASAYRTIGDPVPSLLVDFYGDFSNFAAPAWGIDKLAVTFPDRLIAVDGRPFDARTDGYANGPARRLYALVGELKAHGQQSAKLTFAHGNGEVVVVCNLRAWTFSEIVILFGIYALVGCFVLWSGLMVFLIAGRRAGARAYTFLCVGSFPFMLTLFDYHTRGRFVPLFSIGMLWTAVGCVWLAYAFPEPPLRFRSALRGGTIAMAAAGAALAGLWILATIRGWDSQLFRRLVNYFFEISHALIAVSLLLRLRSARGRARAELLSAVYALALLPIVIPIGMLFGGASFYVVLPCLIGVLPLSIGYALVRHNILATTSVLTRRLLLVPTTLIASTAGCFVWVAVHGSMANQSVSRLALYLAALGFLGFFSLTRWLANRTMFPAASQFRPTIEQLSDQLGSLRDRDAIREAVGRVVARWLSTRSVEVLDFDALAGLARLPDRYAERLRAGERLWTEDNPWQRELLVPMRSLGELRAVLRVAPGHQAALYTNEDLALLETVASLGAVALHNAEIRDQLDGLRRLQVEAARDEKTLALSVLAAEVSHEIAYPLNFFRYLLKRVREGRPPGDQDLQLGGEEVERLQRMLATMRRLQSPAPRLKPVSIEAPLLRALDLLRETIEEQRIGIEIDLAPAIEVLADPDPLLQLFANLLRNAAEAAGPNGSIGICTRAVDDGCEIEIWDSGPGVDPAVQDSIFNPWITTRPQGSGLGLAVSHRIVRSLGWDITFGRSNERTFFRIRAKEKQ